MEYNWLFEKDDSKIHQKRIKNNKEKKDLLNKQIYIFDQDGTLYIDNNPLSGAVEFLKYLKKIDKKIVFISNNSSRSTISYQKKLADILKTDIAKDQIYNSTLATIAYMKKKGISKIYTIGTNEFNEELVNHDFILTDKNPELIVVAFDTTLTYEKLKKSSLFIQKGIDYIATHPDKVCPTMEGFIPDTGSFIALLKTATNKEPKHIFGKPNPNLINTLLKKFNAKPADVIIFGDRIYTDIKMGKKCNVTTALMLTGESKLKDIIKYKIYPDFIFKNLNETLSLMKSQ
jgi:NagD protein